MNPLRTIKTAAVALTIACSALAQVPDYRDIKTPPLRQVNIPQPKRIQLANGMVIFLQQDRELPLIRGSAIIRGGERDVPAAKSGLVTILGQAWRTGGTQAKTGDELDQLLESRAAIVETSGDDDSTSVTMNILKEDLDAVYPVWVDLLRSPAFRQEKIDLAKTQMNTAISRRNDDPGSILSRELLKLGYGSDSPYARHPEYATVASITRDDLLAFHKQFVHPNNIILGFVGDFDVAQMERRLRHTFEKWPRGPQAPKPSVAGNPAKPGVYFVTKSDVTQSNIAMVHPGTTRNNPDYYAIAVMNEILSGGFSGRLMQRLRSERGLTYGARGGLGAGWDHPALFSVSMATKSGTTLEAIEALRNEVAALANSPVTPQELALAKESILNAYVFQMDSRAKALNQQILLEFYGFPQNYFETFPREIEKVTTADVERVGKKYVRSDQLAVLVVGKEGDFEKPLSTLGNVTAIDITIPDLNASPAGAPATAAATSSTAEGLALASKVRDAMGGKGRLDSIKSLRVTTKRSMQTPAGAMEGTVVTTIRYPDSMRQEMTLSMGVITTVVTPAGAFVITPVGTQDLPSSQREAIASQLQSEMINVLKNIGAPGYVFTLGATEKVGEPTAQTLEVNANGARVKWLVDPATGRVLRRTSSGGGAGEMVTTFSDWKTFDGLTVAAAETTTRNGEPAGTGTTTSVEINPAVDEKLFSKPSP